MNAKIWFTILVLLGTAKAIEAEPLIFGRALTSATCPPACYNCPDDYCQKPLPCVRPVCGSLPDDYCPKPLPCVPCPVRGCGDDYCAKPFPSCLPPSIRPWYTCGPTAGPCPGCPAPAQPGPSR
jgi:hypothetical protein